MENVSPELGIKDDIKHFELSASNQRLHIAIVGHVDHGKATLVGRLLHETGALPDGKIESIKNMCKRRGMEFEWAFVMDAFQAERNQAITIDSAHIFSFPAVFGSVLYVNSIPLRALSIDSAEDLHYHPM